MKRYTAYLLLAAVAVTACQRNLEPSNDSSDAIRFVASVTSTATRTVYTGDGTVGWEAVDWGDGGNNTGEVVAKERIEWLSGDRISIFCPNAADAKTASYAIEGETHEEGLPSSASTSVSAVTSGSALKWNNFATHYFFGRYPDPSWSGAPSEAAFTSQSQESSSFTCVIPASQTLTREENSYTFNPDMGYCYMTAYAESKPGYDVALLFKPAVSAFEVAIPVGYLNGQVSSVKLVSSAHRLSGTYTVKIGNTPAYTIDESSLSEADRTVAANLGSAVGVAPGETLVVTLFTCPVAVAGTDEDHLTVVITLADNQVLTLPLKHGNTWYAYEPGNKYRITCGEVVSGEPVFTVDAEGHKVVFARGNLMAKIGSYPTDELVTVSEWKFGEPWEYVGDGESDGNYLFYAGSSDCVGKWVDRFKWQGASSSSDFRNNGLICPITTIGDYYAYYGSADGEPLYDGCWNGLTISNVGDYSWRVLTSSEWSYLSEGRSCTQQCVLATVAGCEGLILFPDYYVHPFGVEPINDGSDAPELPGLPIISIKEANFSDNIYDSADWTALESAGCVFLPDGLYWSSTSYGMGYADCLQISELEIVSITNKQRQSTRSVRLVRDLN